MGTQTLYAQYFQWDFALEFISLVPFQASQPWESSEFPYIQDKNYDNFQVLFCHISKVTGLRILPVVGPENWSEALLEDTSKTLLNLLAMLRKCEQHVYQQLFPSFLSLFPLTKSFSETF